MEQPQVGGMAKKAAKKKTPEAFRQCANIRSKKHPGSRCSFAATQGEFCARHSKNPLRYQEKHTLDAENSVSNTSAAGKIQRWWRFRVGFLRFQRQGPAVNLPELSENQSDVYTLESTSTIPILYRWSYADEKQHIWLFDVRSLCMTRSQDSREALLNPYTRAKISESAEKQFQNRCKWLRDRKYCLVHLAETTDLTPEQIWHQRLLDVSMKYDMLGYHMCLDWFEELSLGRLALFYTELWELWFYRLQLSNQVKQQVVPNWMKAETMLFKWSPQELRTRTEKKWWQKMMLDILERLVSSAQLKEHKTLGALYGMTAFAIVSPKVREHYPWLVEMPEEDY